eukprot:3696550-Rhodomonas_salina.4
MRHAWRDRVALEWDPFHFMDAGYFTVRSRSLPSPLPLEPPRSLNSQPHPAFLTLLSPSTPPPPSCWCWMQAQER